jgi:lipopolysaccharide transport system ATP-binding protein
MSSSDIAIKVENLSKRYRIGVKEEIHDSFLGALLDFLRRPIKNYRKYRGLYKFDDVEPDSDQNSTGTPSDIIWALRDVSFEVKRGEVLGIIGRNGAGKSTLLKILCRITVPDSGRAEIHGRVSSLLEVGTGFHQELTGRENVYLNGTILGMTKKEVEQKFDAIVDFSGVEKFIDTPVKRYSSGMMVRLAFSVAAHLEPEILVIDEVLAVGDADFQRKCLNKMKDVGQEGRTVIFVSHNMPAIMRMCDRVILLDEGRVIADGPSKEVVSNYLTAGSCIPTQHEWLDLAKAPGGEVARLHAVRVLMEDGRIQNTVDITQPLRVEMDFEVLKPGHILLPHFGLINEEGECAFITVDQDPTWRRRPRPKGRYVSTVWIPGNLLAEGTVFVDSHLITLEPDRVIFSEEAVVAFQVADGFTGDSARGDYVKDFPGIVRPLLKWTTRVLGANELNCQHKELLGNENREFEI